MWKGKNEKALEVLKLLHHDPTLPSDDDALAEFQQISQQVELDRAEAVTFLRLFQKLTWRRRTVPVMVLLFMQQASGIYGMVNFFPLLIESLGITGDIPLILYGKVVPPRGAEGVCIDGREAVYTIVATIAIGAFIVVLDKFGRRSLICK